MNMNSGMLAGQLGYPSEEVEVARRLAKYAGNQNEKEQIMFGWTSG